MSRTAIRHSLPVTDEHLLAADLMSLDGVSSVEFLARGFDRIALVTFDAGVRDAEEIMTFVLAGRDPQALDVPLSSI